MSLMEFLSTPSARRATACKSKPLFQKFLISIHALREEGDISVTTTQYPQKEFLSTPSVRRATISSR